MATIPQPDDTIFDSDPDYGVADSSQLPWQRWSFFKESSYVAGIYADSLRDNFITDGVAPANIPRLARLKAQYNAETSRARPRLDVLLKIEAHLVHILPPEVTQNRFWAILDRFERVVPSATRAQYWSTVPPRGDPLWKDAPFLVSQARTLLDTIHSNYLINMGREKSTRRLKVILLSMFTAATVILSIWYGVGGSGTSHALAYVILAYAGMLGAIMSILQRLQTAVSHDAMTTDGVFELTGLRLGWTGIVVSVISGGIFALVLYFIVMAGLFTAAVPAAVMDDQSPSAQTMANRLDKQIKYLQKRETDKLTELAKPTVSAPPVPPAQTGTASATPAPTPSGRAKLEADIASIKQEIAEKQRDLEFVKEEAAVMAPEVNANATNGDKLATALGLGGGASFFKMLILAFLAGFAERMVPDILERLRKNVNGS